jgi:[ribosomal protein S18]-alanine N-acetyltransferase
VSRSPARKPLAAKLRRGRISDLDALIALERAVFKTEPLSRQSLRHFFVSPSAKLIVAEHRGKLAGYVLVRYSSRTTIARVYSIAVNPKLKGLGLGGLLLAAAEKDANRHHRRAIRLEVRKYAARAIKLYKRSGYRRFGKYPRYYDGRFDALRFEKALVEPRRR